MKMKLSVLSVAFLMVMGLAGCSEEQRSDVKQAAEDTAAEVKESASDAADSVQAMASDAADAAGDAYDSAAETASDAYDATANKFNEAVESMNQAGSSPDLVAEVIFAAATDETTRLRYPAGADAEAMIARRNEVGDEAFVAGIRQQLLS